MRGQPVLVTGVGVVSPFGVGLDAFHGGLVRGKRAAVERPAGKERVALAKAASFEAAEFVDSRALKYVGPATRMLSVAVKLALADARLETAEEEIALVVGTAMGNLPQTASYARRIVRGSPAELSPMLGFDAAQNSATSFASAVCGIRGCVRTIACGWISSGVAIEIAMRMIGLGLAPIVVAGGVEQADPLLAELYEALGFFRSETSAQLSQAPPRRAFLGEGAFVMVLETVDTARKRKPKVYGRIAAALSSSGHPVQSSVRAASPFLEKALAGAEKGPGEIDAVSAGGCAIAPEDEFQRAGLRGVAGEGVPVAAIGALIGETCGAATAAQAIHALASINYRELPGVAEEGKEEAGALDAEVLSRPRRGHFRNVLVCSSDPGGGLSAVVVSEIEP